MYKLIPHRNGMLLIDEIIEKFDGGIVTKSHVNENWPLFSNGFVDSLVLIELVAQTAAAVKGIKDMGENQSNVGLGGFLVGIKTAKLHISKIRKGTFLETCSTIRYEIGHLTEFTGEVKINGAMAAETEIQVFRPGDIFSD